MDSKQHASSVIARLMGLDEKPPQQTVCKPRRVLSENYLQKSASIGLLEKWSYHRSCSFTVNYEKGQEPVNVSDSPELPTIDVPYIHFIQVGKANSSITEAQSFGSHRLTYAKCLFMNDKFWPTTDILEELDSGKDLLLTPHQQPDSLFTNDLHELRFGQPQSLSGHVTVLKSSNSPYNSTSEISGTAERITAQRNVFRPLQILENGKHVSRQITHSISSSLTEASRIEMSNNRTSTKVSKIIMPSCTRFFDWKYRYQTIYPHLNRPSFAKQAKVLGRWKMTKSFQESGVASRGTALSEMLTTTDQETRSNLNYKLDASGLPNQSSLDVGDADLSSPSSISSRDGLKTKCSKSLTRSESVPGCIPKPRTTSKAVCNDFYLKLKESVSQGQSTSRKQNCSLKESSEVHVLRTSNEKAKTCSYRDLRKSHNIPETRFILDELDNKLEKVDFYEGSSVNCNLTRCSGSCADLEYDHIVQGNMVIQNELKNNSGEMENNVSGNTEENYTFPIPTISTVLVEVAESKSEGMSSGTSEEQQSEPVACFLFTENGESSHLLDASVGQETSNKLHERNSPSPNSVLESIFSEETLSLECQSDCADLHGLRMHLQLLKSETQDTNSEGPGMVVSSDEESGDESADLSEENRKLEGFFRAEESRDFSYVVDVLDEAGFHGIDMQLEFGKCYSPVCPVNPSVFEMLEKKYGEQTCWERSERRLLFDSINLELKEILQPCRDMLTWAKPLRKRFNTSQSREVIEEELWMFLASQDKEVSKDLSEKALGTEIWWFNLQDDVDLIVFEIQCFLFDELAAELVSIESFF